MDVLGLLERDHAALWSLTLGEYCDLMIARRYAAWHRMSERAAAARWSLAAQYGKNTPSVQDLAGVWHHGEILDVEEKTARCIAKAEREAANRGRR